MYVYMYRFMSQQLAFWYNTNSLLCNIKILQNVNYYQRQVDHQKFEIGPIVAQVPQFAHPYCKVTILLHICQSYLPRLILLAEVRTNQFFRELTTPITPLMKEVKHTHIAPSIA